jgi:hypothetical protein
MLHAGHQIRLLSYCWSIEYEIGARAANKLRFIRFLRYFGNDGKFAVKSGNRRIFGHEFIVIFLLGSSWDGSVDVQIGLSL